jgi:hypothetical protein
LLLIGEIPRTQIVPDINEEQGVAKPSSGWQEQSEERIKVDIKANGSTAFSRDTNPLLNILTHNQKGSILISKVFLVHYIG